MRGILSHAGYIPYRRLDRSTIAAIAGSGGGKGFRSVASYDEDTTTMGFEAARLALRSVPGCAPAALYFSTTTPAYADKTNATAIHAALRLPSGVIAADLGGAARSAVAAVRLSLSAGEPALVVAADMRNGLPGGPDESGGGDAGSALLVGSEVDGQLVAEYLGGASATAEFLDRWRTPGDRSSKLWEERFGEVRYVESGDEAWITALKTADIGVDDVDHLIVTGTHERAVRALPKKLGHPAAADDLTASIGQSGSAHPGLVLSSVLEQATPGQVIALVSLADGADVLLFRRTGVAAPSSRPVAQQIGRAGVITYGKFLAWRGFLPVEPPRRPEPARVSASAAARSTEWKFGFVGSRAVDSGRITLPPSVAGAGAASEPAPMAEAEGTIVTFTVDKLAYSASPPIVFAVVDFDGGGRLPIELTDVDATDVAIGGRVELTFRRLSTADGIHNYFWKARPA